jgi:hypothetical protein
VDAGSIAAISSGAVALAAIGAGELRNRRTLHHSRMIADLESVRDVLDEGAVALHDTEYALNEVRFGLTQHGLSFFDDEQRTKAYDDLGRAGKELDRLKERLRIRLGRGHEVVAAFEAADAAVLETYRTMWGVRREGTDASDEDRVQLRRERFIEERQERVRAQREVFDAKRDQFIDAAQRVAGADLRANS